MNQWLRTTRTGIPHWEAFFTQGMADEVPREPSSFARWVADRTAPDVEILEIGSGTGRDAIWFAGQGRKVLPNDYCAAARRYATERAAEAGQQVVFRPLNVNSQHSLLVRAARLARRPVAKHVYLRDLLGSLETSARPGLWRFCSMVGRTGGHTYLEFTTGARRPHAERFVPAADVRAEIERAGGRIVTEEATSEGGKALCRMEVTWTR
jgi:SAM-dependent methyltransferase